MAQAVCMYTIDLDTILQIIYTDFNILSPLCVLPSFQIHCTCVETDMRANRMKNRQDRNQKENIKTDKDKYVYIVHICGRHL